MAKERVRAAVVGATGYGGAEVVRLLLGHPNVDVTLATSGRLAGKPLAQECPWLDTDLILRTFNVEALEADVVFLCQEAGFAMQHAEKILAKAKIVDLSADFRLASAETYEAYYGHPHTASGLLESAEYGLPEVNREGIRSARLVANPGCYPTASLLALLPILRSGLVPEGSIPVIDAKSGVSGAGRAKADTSYTFSELTGGLNAYLPARHRHRPEIEQAAGCKVRFTPHLIPIARGIEATVHVPTSATSAEQLREIYRAAYADEPFVRVVTVPPSTKQVLGSNRCDVFVDLDPHTGFAVVCSAIDNLTKGAGGQAVQNMNLMFDLPEVAGLSTCGVWP